MKTIEPILSCLTSLTIVDDLRQTLREKDPEFLPAEEKFQEAIATLTEKLGIIVLTNISNSSYGTHFPTSAIQNNSSPHLILFEKTVFG